MLRITPTQIVNPKTTTTTPRLINTSTNSISIPTLITLANIAALISSKNIGDQEPKIEDNDHWITM